jgi:hypothetical protein
MFWTLLLQVLRAYDTRFGHSDARPDLYEEAELAPGTELVCRIGDKNLGAVANSTAGSGGAKATETATTTPPAAAARRDDGARRLDLKLRDRRRKVYDPWVRQEWMWELAGEMLVLATPFREGRHYATSPKDFVPIIRFLQRMHHLGCVHGDVRCANIVFGAGLLIDLDMGGRLSDHPRYPDGYQRSLPDGSRLGRHGELITPWHDWYAMLGLVFSLHRIRPPPDLPRTISWYAEQETFTRYCYGTELVDADAMADELVEYLELAEASGYQIMYSYELAEIVAEDWSE